MGQINMGFSGALVAYLDMLARRGTHGDTIERVIETLIYDGLRKAVVDGFIKCCDVNPPSDLFKDQQEGE